MKNRCYPRHFPLVNAGLVGAFLIAMPALRADLTNGQPAQSVLGKPDFTNTTANAPTATQVNSPGGIAIDAVTKKLFVADRGNHRVLRFATAASYATGAAAEAVFGQADFVSGSANRGGAVARNTLDGPRAVHVDAAGRLWVADSANNRVLRFDGASSKASGVNADAVLGQSNFISELAALSQSGMNFPVAVATDAGGNLYVADNLNNRVLVFNNAADKGDGANADRVLGSQPLAPIPPVPPPPSFSSRVALPSTRRGVSGLPILQTTAFCVLTMPPRLRAGRRPLRCWGRRISPRKPPNRLRRRV
jgi:DNA-binding beta-propeller fold protein YncE